jgi:protein required for attachment to host cells
MTQKKSTPKKAPKRVQRVERVERVSSKKRARSPSSSSEEESDTRSPSSSFEEEKEIKKRRKTTKISWPILHEKPRRRNERRRLKGRFSFGSVDFFTNILLIEIMIANPNRLRVLRKEQKNKNRFWWT